MEALAERGDIALVAPTMAPAATALITLDPAKYVAEVFRPYRAELALLKAEAATITYDITTTAGMKTAVEWRAKMRTLRLGAEQARKERKAPILEIGKLLDSRAAELKDEIEPLEARFDKDIKAEETRKEQEKQAKIAAERARIDGHRQRISALMALPAQALAKTSNEIAALILGIEPAPAADALQEFAEEYAIVRADTLAKLNKAQATQEAAEAAAEQQRIEAERLAAERAELAQLRAEAEKRRQAAEAEAQRVAAEQAAAEASLRAAAEAHSREVERAKQEQERVATETKRQLEAQQAAINEQRRALEQKQREAEAAAQRDADHGEALAMNAEYDAERARLQAASEQLLQDARHPAAVEALVADANLMDKADQLIADELWPEDSELVDEIRAMFRREWGMDEQQADARMARFDYTQVAARAAAEAA